MPHPSAGFDLLLEKYQHYRTTVGQDETLLSELSESKVFERTVLQRRLQINRERCEYLRKALRGLYPESSKLTTQLRMPEDDIRDGLLALQQSAEAIQRAQQVRDVFAVSLEPRVKSHQSTIAMFAQAYCWLRFSRIGDAVDLVSELTLFNKVTGIVDSLSSKVSTAQHAGRSLRQRLTHIFDQLKELRKLNVSDDELLVSRVDRSLRSWLQNTASTFSIANIGSHIAQFPLTRTFFGFAALTFWILFRLQWLMSLVGLRPFHVLLSQSSQEQPDSRDRLFPSKRFQYEDRFDSVLQPLLRPTSSQDDYDMYRTYGRERPGMMTLGSDQYSAALPYAYHSYMRPGGGFGF